jgi:hypothetical protein
MLTATNLEARRFAARILRSILEAHPGRGSRRQQGSNPERHEYELYRAIENIDHTRTKARSPQTNGICDRFDQIASRR